ncbi:RNA-binding S4 domain-containing protein [Alisedimentitalea sp. MJ-SS2]|uniref:RNA-binding S4 domain-containing protein n=1 Tax=Aliisedimentitalea sp. MJ-SS2 TaxID=3049795 RepID=UPI00290C1783|nr:RNA-binding S4 domain-containing protein [Alisedimentitalea sp. MJ-SS2]MDU8927501.1 RNA-binding S4 domain-containing protein [Alisedimentitalea sp. MJ-SS2]
MSEGAARIRLDKWLWYARFFKTRGLASKQVSGGHVRVNGDRVSKPAHSVAPGDVLTFAQARQIRVVKILDVGKRRGPAPEARALYEDLTPPPEPDAPPAPPRVGARPTKRDRRVLDAFKKPDA